MRKTGKGIQPAPVTRRKALKVIAGLTELDVSYPLLGTANSLEVIHPDSPRAFPFASTGWKTELTTTPPSLTAPWT